jgi:hypothetical protein
MGSFSSWQSSWGRALWAAALEAGGRGLGAPVFELLVVGCAAVEAQGPYAMRTTCGGGRGGVPNVRMLRPGITRELLLRGGVYISTQ